MQWVICSSGNINHSQSFFHFVLQQFNCFSRWKLLLAFLGFSLLSAAFSFANASAVEFLFSAVKYVWGSNVLFFADSLQLHQVCFPNFILFSLVF